LPNNKKNISKSEIIRGFNVYKDTIKYSKSKINGNIKVYYKFDKPEISGSMLSTPVSINPKVGFLVSKRIFSKSVTRNKIRRQIKEAYREVKKSLIEKYNPSGLKLVLTLSGKGNETVKLNKKLNYKEIKSEMAIILDKIFFETKNRY
jgi:ribonuclease P protein component